MAYTAIEEVGCLSWSGEVAGGDAGNRATVWGGEVEELGCGEGQGDDWGFCCGVAIVLETKVASESSLMARAPKPLDGILGTQMDVSGG